MNKRNWSQYNQNLVKRGNITFFIDTKVLSGSPSVNKKGRP